MEYELTILDLPDVLFAECVDFMPFNDLLSYIGEGEIANLYRANPTAVAPKMVLSAMFDAHPWGYDFDWTIDWTDLFAARRHYRDTAVKLGFNVKTCANIIVDGHMAVSRLALAWHVGIDEVALISSHVVNYRRNKERECKASFDEWVAFENVFLPLTAQSVTVSRIYVLFCESWECWGRGHNYDSVAKWREGNQKGKIYFMSDKRGGEEVGWNQEVARRLQSEIYWQKFKEYNDEQDRKRKRVV